MEGYNIELSKMILNGLKKAYDDDKKKTAERKKRQKKTSK